MHTPFQFCTMDWKLYLFLLIEPKIITKPAPYPQGLKHTALNYATGCGTGSIPDGGEIFSLCMGSMTGWVIWVATDL